MESIGNVLRIILILIEVVVIFNLMIVVHELGHYLAARWRGLVIDRFGIWFGKPIWKKKIRGVDFCLGWIPAGGYVALPQMAAMESIEGKNSVEGKDLPSITPVDKIIVAFAGPLFSLGLAFVFALIVMGVGKPVSEGDKERIIGYVVEDSPAAKAVGSDGSKGLKAGDRILQVDGRPVRQFNGMTNSVRWGIVRSEGDKIPFVVERDGKEITFLSDFDREKRPFWLRQGLREVGIAAAELPLVAAVQPGTAPAQAGVQKGDLITAIDGKKVYNWIGVEDILSGLKNPATLTVLRGDQTLNLTISPPHAVVGGVPEVPRSPAKAAGLQAKDIILAANGAPILGSKDLTELVKKEKGAPIKLSVQRDGKPLDLTITPALAKIGDQIQPEYKIGVGLSCGILWSPEGKTKLDYPNPFDEIVDGATALVNTVSALLSPKSDIKLNQMGGPVQIGNVYYRLLESPDGWRRALWFSVILNVNLALMNLLPLPVLDGGHITLSLLELIRRRPMNVRVVEFLQTSCALVLIGFMLYVTVFDVGDLFRKKPTFEFVQSASPPP